MIIGEKIRLARLFREYSQENMAEMLKVSTTAYRNMEKNSKLSDLRFKQISDVLQMSEDDIKAIGEKGFFNSFNGNSNNNIVNSSIGDNAKELISQINIKELELKNKDLEVLNLKLQKELLEEKLRRFESMS